MSGAQVEIKDGSYKPAGGMSDMRQAHVSGAGRGQVAVFVAEFRAHAGREGE